MIKYIPTLAQLKRWRNETTILLASAMAALVALHETIEPLANLHPGFKAASVVIGGLIQRWNAYGKETIEVDLPAMEEPVGDV